MDMIIIVIIYLSHFFTHMHVQDAKRYLIRIVCVYCCAELVNLRHDSVYICVCVCVCTCESIWSWARGLQGENEWAHLPAVLCFKSFHSSVLQFYLWKITRNALYRLARLPDRASKTHIVSLCHCLLYFFFYYHHHLALSLQVYLTFIVLDYQMHHPVCLFASYMFHVFNRLRKWKTTSEPDFLLISSLVQLSCNATL